MATSKIPTELASNLKQTSDITSLSYGWTGTVTYTQLGKLMLVSGSVTAPSTIQTGSIVALPNSNLPKRFSGQRARKTSDGSYVDCYVHTNGYIVIPEPTASENYQFDFCFMLA